MVLTCLKQHWLIALATDLLIKSSLCHHPPSSSVTSDAGHFTRSAAEQLSPRQHDAVVTCFFYKPCCQPGSEETSVIHFTDMETEAQGEGSRSLLVSLTSKMNSRPNLSDWLGYSQATRTDLHLEDNIPRVSIVPLSANQHKLLQ